MVFSITGIFRGVIQSNRKSSTMSPAAERGNPIIWRRESKYEDLPN